MKRLTVKTFTADIYIAGDIARIREICGEYCESGFCVSIKPCEWVYTHGRETGAVVGLINYPRFPREFKEIKERAFELAEILIKGAHQGSCSIVFPDETTFISRRGDL